MKTILTGVLALGLSAVSGWAKAAETPCADLAKLKLAHGEVTSATMVAKGAFTPPKGQGGGNQTAVFAAMPAFCRLRASLHPTKDSDIKIEVWLPAEGWNGRMESVGNGGFSSAIQYSQLGQAVAKGYAGAATNTGQETDDATFSYGHPEKIKDWGWRAVHEMTVAAKAIIAARYGQGPRFSYWNSCSTGGRQGLVEAEYFPKDYDGLAVGDPANPMTRLQAGGFWANRALTSDKASFITQVQWAMIHRRVVAQCDALDGLKDGLIEDPRACHFDIETLQCKAAQDGDACLTGPQVEALGKVVRGATNPRTGRSIYPGYPAGTAMLPGPVARLQTPDPAGIATYRMLFQAPDWDWHSFDFDKDVARGDKLGNSTINAVDEKRLKGLFAHGGKLLMYHGWDDPAITPLISIDYYEKAMAANGGKGRTYGSMRLFMVPGMLHCGGGEGPNVWDKVDVLSAWVERGQAPDQIVASHMTDGAVDRTRPLCPYPQAAKYKGSGSIDDAANFACKAP